MAEWPSGSDDHLSPLLPDLAEARLGQKKYKTYEYLPDTGGKLGWYRLAPGQPGALTMLHWNVEGHRTGPITR